MFTHMPNKVLAEREILALAEINGAFLNRLPKLLKALQRGKKTIDICKVVDEKIRHRNETKNQIKTDAIEHMKECLLKLKMSSFADHPLVKPELTRALEVIFDRKIEINGIVSRALTRVLLGEGQRGHNPQDVWCHVDVAYEALSKVAAVVAQFGPDPLFEGWAEIDFNHIHAQKFTETLPLDAKGRVNMTIPERWTLAEQLERGVECLEVEWHEFEKDGQVYRYQTVYAQYGVILKLIWPKKTETILPCQIKNRTVTWQDLIGSDLPSVWEFLNILALFSTYEPASIPPSHPINSWQDIEDFAEQADVGYYLSCFRSKNENAHPLTLIQLKTLIDRFLNMIESELCEKDQVRGRTFYYKEAKKFIEEELMQKVMDLNECDRNKFTLPMAFQYVSQIAIRQEKETELRDAIRLTTVEELVPLLREKLEKIGIKWKPKGGRPSNISKNEKKVKAKKSKHTAPVF